MSLLSWRAVAGPGRPYLPSCRLLYRGTIDRDGDTRPRKHEHLIHLYALVPEEPTRGRVCDAKPPSRRPRRPAVHQLSSNGPWRSGEETKRRLCETDGSRLRSGRSCNAQCESQPAAPLGNGLVDVWVWYFIARREKPDRHIAMTAST